jgi:hypothetical protein
MKRGGYTSKLIAEPNTWHVSGNGLIHEYGNYRHCYLVVRKTDYGKYIPHIGSNATVNYPGADLPERGWFEYDTLEEAKNHMYKYVDYIRDVYDIEEKKLLSNRLLTNIS